MVSFSMITGRPRQLNVSRRNRVSFLSRLRGSKKKGTSLEPDEAAPEIGEDRLEGTNPAVFPQLIGYIPRFPEPPPYTKVRTRGKTEKAFDRVFLAQELRGRTGLEIAQAGGRHLNPGERWQNSDAVWAMEFSKDGKYLAAGSHDHVIRVWAVIATEEDRHAAENQERPPIPDELRARLSAPVFKTLSVQEYGDHKATILDLSWSKVFLIRGQTEGTESADAFCRTISYSRPPWTRRFDCGM
jgi:WD repeat-containing protein 44